MVLIRVLYFFISLFVNFFLVSCQSPQQIAGIEHKLVVDKWNSLSKYAYGVLNRYELSIGARLSVDDSQFKKNFVLSDFKLLHQTSALQIDLLAPSFEEKIICMPQCSLITEYVADSSVNATLLKQYFDDVEFKLFKFYGDLVLLDGAFKELESLNADLFPSYLNWLIAQNASFDSLLELTDYLNEKLSKEEFVGFINDPKKLYSLIELDNTLRVDDNFSNDLSGVNGELPAFELSQFSSEEPQELLYIQKIQDAKELVNIESEFLLTEEADWKENIADIIESEFWPKSDVGNDGVVATITSKQVDWQQLQNFEIAIGDQICSYSENYFGFVTDVVGNKYSAYVIGKMQIEIDNVLTDAPEGAIFNRPTAGDFAIIKEPIVLNKDNVAPCDIALLNK